MHSALRSIACLALLAAFQQPKPAEKPAVAPSAQEPAAKSAGASVAVVHLDGTIASVAADQLSPAEALRQNAAFLRWSNSGPPQGEILPNERVEIALANGELLLGKTSGGKGDRLHVELAAGASVAVSVDGLRRLVFPRRLNEEESASLDAPANGDRLWRKSGDRLERLDGTFEAFSDDGVGFESVLGKKTFPWSEVVALFVEAVSSDKARAAQDADSPPVWIDLIDGSRIHGDWKSIDAKTLRIEREHAAITLSLAWLDELVIDDGRVRFLSELAPSSADERSPFGDEVGLALPHRVDRSVTGKPLRAGGRLWRRGIGVHAPSSLTWTLDPTWKELRGSAAIDDQVARLPGKGSVRFRVKLDGKVAWESAVLRSNDAPVELPGIALAGAHELTLEVDPADNFHVADRADWLGVYLVRRS
jgi:hypothetical protein